MFHDGTNRDRCTANFVILVGVISLIESETLSVETPEMPLAHAIGLVSEVYHPALLDERRLVLSLSLSY